MDRTFERQTTLPVAVIITVLLCSGGLVGCDGDSSVAPNGPDTVEVAIINAWNDEFTVDAELALTPEERSAGLSNRRSLDENSGMLFVFDSQLRKELQLL